MGESEHEEQRSNATRDELRARRGTSRDHISERTQELGDERIAESRHGTPDPATAPPGQLRKDQRYKGAR